MKNLILLLLCFVFEARARIWFAPNHQPVVMANHIKCHQHEQLCSNQDSVRNTQVCDTGSMLQDAVDQFDCGEAEPTVSIRSGIVITVISWKLLQWAGNS